jgi:hypothetical protein
LFKKYFLFLNLKKKSKILKKIFFSKFKTPFFTYIVFLVTKFYLNKIFSNNHLININNVFCINDFYFYMNYFNFLVSLYFNDFYFFLNTILLLSGLWVFFFKLNINLTKITTKNNSNINVLKINSNSSFVSFYLYVIIYKLIDTYLIHGKNSLVWFNHFNLNNFTVFILYTFIVLSFLVFYLLKNVTKKTNLTKSIDYLFSINNLVLLLPFLFFVNTVFTFLFFLETISVVLFYKLISSKI